MIYEGGSEHADQVKNITGIKKQTNVTIPSNQMFVRFETSLTTAKKRFRALIHKIGKYIHPLCVVSNIVIWPIVLVYLVA